MSKKFYDSQESNRLADLDILPLSHLLYMTLRLAFDKTPDCGLFQVTIKQMMNITGIYDRTLITDVLLPELNRNNLVYFDNNVVFVPGTAETESCESKLHGGNKQHASAFLSALKDCESIISIASNYGGQNLAVKRFIEYWSDSIDLLISDFAISEAELQELELKSERNTLSLEENKRFLTLKKAIQAFYSCKTIANRKKSYLQNSSEITPNPRRTHAEPISNPSATHAEPMAQKQPTHAEPMLNPSATHAEPIGIPPPTHLGYGKKDRGEEEVFPLSGENREGVWGNQFGLKEKFPSNPMDLPDGWGHTGGTKVNPNGLGRLLPSPSERESNSLETNDIQPQNESTEYVSMARQIYNRHMAEAAQSGESSPQTEEPERISMARQIYNRHMAEEAQSAESNPLATNDIPSQIEVPEYVSTARQIQRRHAAEAAQSESGTTADGDSDILQPRPG